MPSYLLDKNHPVTRALMAIVYTHPDVMAAWDRYRRPAGGDEVTTEALPAFLSGFLTTHHPAWAQYQLALAVERDIGPVTVPRKPDAVDSSVPRGQSDGGASQSFIDRRDAKLQAERDYWRRWDEWSAAVKSAPWYSSLWQAVLVVNSQRLRDGLPASVGRFRALALVARYGTTSLQEYAASQGLPMPRRGS